MTLINVLFNIGFMSFTSSFANLFQTILRYTNSEIYEHIKESPIELKALMEMLPEESYYHQDFQTFIYKDNKFDSEEIPTLAGSLEVLKSISMEELLPFYNFISTFPLLGMYHSLGKRIFDDINTMTESNLKFKIPQKLYHGRIREIEEKSLNMYEMLEPPYDSASHGRLNMLGIPALYLSDDLDTVIKEVRWKDGLNPVDGFETTIHGNFNMLDLRDSDCPLFKYCYFKSTKPNHLSAYIIPNFIADCCRHRGLDGIIYNSVQNSKATNYVFFNSSKKWFEKIKLFSWDGNFNWLKNS